MQIVRYLAYPGKKRPLRPACFLCICHYLLKHCTMSNNLVFTISQPLVLIDGQDLRFQEYLKRDEIISALTVPLKVREKAMGVLSVNRKDKKEIFTQDNLRIITSFAAFKVAMISAG